jgi:hypothetical protein
MLANALILFWGLKPILGFLDDLIFTLLFYHKYIETTDTQNNYGKETEGHFKPA